MPDIFQFQIQVDDRHIDTNGHVNNVSYVQWMQDVAIEHSKVQDALVLLHEIGATWVVRSHFVEYLAPAMPGEKIEVQTWVSNIKKVRSLRKYRFIRPADGRVLARAETDWVFVDINTGRPRSIPESIGEKYPVIPPEQEP